MPAPSPDAGDPLEHAPGVHMASRPEARCGVHQWVGLSLGKAKEVTSLTPFSLS